MKTITVLLLLLIPALVFPVQVNALCDQGQARVIHAESVPFNSAGTDTMRYWVAPASNSPTFYFVYVTSNQTFINLLNAALISGKEVRVTGDVGACPASGKLRNGGTVVAVFMDYFN